MRYKYKIKEVRKKPVRVFPGGSVVMNLPTMQETHLPTMQETHPPTMQETHLPTMQETQVGSLGWEDPLEKGMVSPLQYSGLENPTDRGD